jgi:hypothetical protein
LAREHGHAVLAIYIANNLSQALVRQGQYARARALQEESLPFARALGERQTIAGSLLTLGLIARLEGDLAEARAHYGAAIRLQWQAGGRTSLLRLLSALAGVMARSGQAGRAARLLGVVAAGRTATGLVVPIPEQEEQEQTVATVRLALGATAFEAAFAAGQALPLEEAVAEVLAEGGDDG